jgi:hypothetical protein
MNKKFTLLLTLLLYYCQAHLHLAQIAAGWYRVQNA